MSNEVNLKTNTFQHIDQARLAAERLGKNAVIVYDKEEQAYTIELKSTVNITTTKQSKEHCEAYEFIEGDTNKTWSNDPNLDKNFGHRVGKNGSLFVISEDDKIYWSDTVDKGKPKQVTHDQLSCLSDKQREPIGKTIIANHAVTMNEHELNDYVNRMGALGSKDIAVDWKKVEEKKGNSVKNKIDEKFPMPQTSPPPQPQQPVPNQNIQPSNETSQTQAQETEEAEQSGTPNPQQTPTNEDDAIVFNALCVKKNRSKIEKQVFEKLANGEALAPPEVKSEYDKILKKRKEDIMVLEELKTQNQKKKFSLNQQKLFEAIINNETLLPDLQTEYDKLLVEAKQVNT